MSPLMQAICDHLSDCCLERYIDNIERDRQSAELDRLYRALSAALPESQWNLLDEYESVLGLRFQAEADALFQAAFAAARELG